jgi:hypothetical protein
MCSDILRSTAIAVALFGSFGIAVAQQPPSAKSTDPQGQAKKAISTVPGKNGKEEPGSHAPSRAQGDGGPVLVNGALNVPGAPKDSQTVPAMFSPRNDEIDTTPIMAMPLGLTGAQKKAILDSVKLANEPVQSTKAKPAEELPDGIAIHDLPVSASVPAVARLKYVRTADRVLLIDPPNRIVVGEIRN